jgi:hypothetical protein
LNEGKRDTRHRPDRYSAERVQTFLLSGRRFWNSGASARSFQADDRKVEDQSHWLELSRYVHLNPVRAGLCRRPEDWKWSSCRGYHRPALRQEWLESASVLAEFGGAVGEPGGVGGVGGRRPEGGKISVAAGAEVG